MPARPTRRRPVVGLLLTALVASALSTAAPASAASPVRDSLERVPSNLRAAIATDRSELDALPRAVVRRAPQAPRGSLRTEPAPTQEPQDSTGPVARGSLTSAPVSNIVVTYVEDGAVWTTAAKAAFESAVQVWERVVESAVPIEVLATATTFDDPAVLGGAGPWNFERNTQGTSTLADDVFEPLALFNAKRGADTRPNDPDIGADFNPGQAGLYFGLDGNPPADQYDFRTVVLHELGHGLGMVGTATVTSTGAATIGDREVNGCATCPRSGVSFDQFTYATNDVQAGNGGKRLLSMADGSAELKAALTGGQLYWAGQLARTAAAVRGTTCENGPRTDDVRLYAPARFLEGTSYGHLDECTYPGEDVDGLMTPFVEQGESIREPGQIAMGILADMGYAVPALRGSRYTALAPVRLLDTRTGLGAPKSAVGPAGVVDLPVAGRNGVPADATAVVLNVTAVAPSAATDIRVYPTPVVLTPVPTVSNLNVVRGITRANLVTVPIGNDGKVRLRNAAGSVQLLADLAGFYAPQAASTFTAADPVRVLDTRSAVGTTTRTPVGPGEVIDLAVTGGASPVPAGASAVAMTVTAVGATASTDVRVYPTPADGTSVPVVSSINVRPGSPVPNVVIVKVGANGNVRLRNQSGSVHLLADVAGWYDASTAGVLFRPLAPVRVLDTRTRLGTSSTSPTTVGPGDAVLLRVAGLAQVPTTASAAVLNVTGVGATASTDIRVYPATQTTPPEVSNLNLARGETAADLVIVKLGNRSVRLRNSSGQVALVADVSGWFGPPA